MKGIAKTIYVIGLCVLVNLFVASCDYDETLENTQVTIELSEPLGGVNVEILNSLGQTFSVVTNSEGKAQITLVPGIYSVSASKTSDDGYVRTAVNGSKSDILVSGTSIIIYLSVVTSKIQINNPILIKELYVGGCQKDDGSGYFAIDKCIILYNNSSQPALLDNVAFGIIEPYNGEASLHTFLSDGVLAYENEGWVPAINGIWYFQQGHYIEPYSELVVNVYGCIDNTLTYSQSINYANPDYFTMYDVEVTSTDGGKYNNTNYYPSPSEVIPTSHYLKAVKYGQGTAWPISMTSPAVFLFRTDNVTPKEYGENPYNKIYPAEKEGNLIYACMKIPRSWIIDAVEVYNREKLSTSKKRLTPDLDSGYVPMTSKQGHAVVRRIESYNDGHPIYQDTNNSSNDFYEADHCSLK